MDRLTNVKEKNILKKKKRSYFSDFDNRMCAGTTEHEQVEGGNTKPSPSRQEKHERPTPIVNHVPAEDGAATQVSPIFVPRPKRVINHR